MERRRQGPRRVVVEGVVPCEVCDECRRGDTNRCATYDELGFTRDGAAMGFLDAPPSLVHPLAPHVTWEAAVLTEPAAVVLRALQRIAPRAGERVAIVGDGTIALLAALLVRQWQPESVTVLGARTAQADLVASAGADRFLTDPADLPPDVTLLIDAAGATGATTDALSRAARGVKLVLLGFPGQGKSLNLVVDDLINNDVEILGSFSYTQTAWRDVVRLLNDGTFDPTFIVTHRFGLSEFAQALSALREPVGARGKILLEVSR